jgi:hypothetical protein
VQLVVIEVLLGSGSVACRERGRGQLEDAAQFIFDALPPSELFFAFHASPG